MCQFGTVTTSTSSWSEDRTESGGTGSATGGLDTREGGSERGQKNRQLGTFLSQMGQGKGPQGENLVGRRLTSMSRRQMSRWRFWQKEGGRLEPGTYQFQK